MKRELSKREIANCEHATTPHCQCRCRGALHGAARGGLNDDGSFDYHFFESLPDSDPHHLQTKQEQRDAANAKCRAETKARNKAVLDAWLRLRDANK